MTENPASLLLQVSYFIMPLFDEKNLGGLGTFINPIPNGRGFQIPPLLNRCPLFLRQRETKQLETSQHFDKALICSCFDTIKKFLGVLEKKWGHAKQAQKSDILTTRGFNPFGIGLNLSKQKKFANKTYLESLTLFHMG